ncbi:MAG: hypothetical protein M5U34_02070 [Chloroflexi bacterium]|nr:hypothetical protein [Chloroflexota bacterium]
MVSYWVVRGRRFFTKQTTVGIWIAIGVYFLFIRLKQKQSRLLVRELLSAFGGIFVISALILIFFGLRGGLAAFWDAAFRYNFIYSAPEGDFVSRLNPIFTGVLLLGQVWLIQLAVIGYGIALLILLRGRILASWRPILEVGLIALPVEWVLVSISGKSYPSLLHQLAADYGLVFWFSFWGIFSGLSTWNKAKGIKPIFQASILLVLVWSAISNFQGQIVKFREIENSAAIHYIESVTQKNDTILLWGAETAVLFLCGAHQPHALCLSIPSLQVKDIPVKR